MQHFYTSDENFWQCIERSSFVVKLLACKFTYPLIGNISDIVKG